MSLSSFSFARLAAVIGIVLTEAILAWGGGWKAAAIFTVVVFAGFSIKRGFASEKKEAGKAKADQQKESNKDEPKIGTEKSGSRLGTILTIVVGAVALIYVGEALISFWQLQEKMNRPVVVEHVKDTLEKDLDILAKETESEKTDIPVHYSYNWDTEVENKSYDVITYDHEGRRNVTFVKPGQKCVSIKGRTKAVAFRTHGDSAFHIVLRIRFGGTGLCREPNQRI